MANTIQQAYDAIKKLEQNNTFPVPIASQTVHVGSLDGKTGKFKFAIPTTTMTVKMGKSSTGKPEFEKITAGVIKLKSVVDLKLSLSVTNAQSTFSATVAGVTVTAPAGQHTVTVDVGLAQSTRDTDGNIETVDGVVQSGTAIADFQLEITRPPIVNAGAFTIPAIPVALVYAPPQGAQNKNFAEYSSMNSSSRKISTTVTSGSSNKSGDAYSTTDFLDKIAGLVSSVQSFIKALPSGNSGSGANQPTTDPVSITGTSIVLALNLLSGILSSTTTSTTTALTTTTEHDLQITDTDTTTMGTPPGLGPGVGDRFVYLRNVQAVWLIASGALSFSILGVEGIRSFTAQDLVSDSKAIGSTPGKTGPATNLDAATIKMFLGLDPFIGNASPTLAQPRFVPNDPATAGGRGTDPNGDAFSVSHDVTTTDITTQTSLTTTITDYKPGWLTALFGSNQATENQTTLGYSNATSQSTEQKTTATVTFFAGPNDPPYLVGLYFDRLFGTFAFTPAPGGQLKGKIGTAVGGTAKIEAGVKVR